MLARIPPRGRVRTGSSIRSRAAGPSIPVDLPAVADLYDRDRRVGVFDQVLDAVVALADAILFFARELFRAGWTRSGGEALNPRGEALPVPLRRSFQLFHRRGLDQKAIACHAASCPSVLPRTTRRAPSPDAQNCPDLQRLRRASAGRPRSEEHTSEY